MWWFNRFAVWRAGGRAVQLVPGSAVDIDAIDALVIGGGDDIDAALYEGVVQPTVRLDRERDLFELKLLSMAMERGVPVLGICRGAQMINVFLGGTLHGCIYTEYRDARRLRTVLPRKRILIEPGTRLASLLGVIQCRVNALHHQSVDRLARALAVVARDEAGIVQAIEGTSKHFLVGVQWHPEFLVFDGRQQRLFAGLVAAARVSPPWNADRETALPQRA